MARTNRSPRERHSEDVAELAASARGGGDTPPGGWRDDPSSRAAMIYGWAAVAVFLAFGLALESLHLVKAPWYFDARLRRELWTLAHAHGTLLGLLTIAYALVAPQAVGPAYLRRRFSRLLRAGALLVPAGFLVGGIGNAEGDPSPAILLVPLGAALALLAVAGVAWSLLRRR